MKFARTFSTLRIVFGLLACLDIFARAENPGASAALTRETVQVGEPLQLQIKLAGTRKTGAPPSVAVDGLDIRYMGPSTQMQMNNFSDVHVSVTHIYQVVPVRAGTFTIPSVAVDVEGRHFTTQPLKLVVSANAGVQPNGAGGDQPVGKVSFAEIILPKKSAYIGEAIPVELRLYVDDRVHWQLETAPQFSGEGFTKAKLTEPRQESARRDGVEYNVVVFRTAVTPSKAGRVTIGPADFSFIAQVPRPRKNRGGSIFDMFDDMMNDPVFAQNQRMTTKADAVELEVKPLPAQGRPKDFAGAVGDFSFSVTGGPTEVKVGDPVTMRLHVTGRGNFDRIEAPAMTESSGWRSYPATSSFQASDDVGVRGMKTFEMAVIPEEQKTAMPAFEFSYFDPEAGKYVTRKSEPARLVVRGGAAPAPPAAVAAPELPQTSEKKAAQPAPTDILGLHYEFGEARTFAPLYLRRGFLLAQLVPLAGVLALIGRRLLRRTDAARRTAQLRHEKSELWRRIRSGCEDPEFYNAATRFVQIETALRDGRRVESVDANVACQSRALDEETREEIDAIFSARSELLYAGAGDSGRRAEGPGRERIVKALERFEKANGTA